MAITVYSSFDKYLGTCESIQAKILAIDLIIDQLLIAMTKAAAGEETTQYSLNDGQTVISATTRSVESISRSIVALEALQNRYRSRLHGRVGRFVDSKNFPSNGFF